LFLFKGSVKMQITTHLTALLHRYDCVIIPGFGAFLTQRQPARINKEKNIFNPPSKSLSFNRQLKENDGILANYIAKTEGISYEQSIQKIRAFIENISEALSKNEKAHLASIGYFYKQDDKILFQPDLTSNFLTESFGTSSFSVERVNRTSAAVVKEKPIVEKIETQTSEVKALPEPEEKTRPAFWKYAAVGVVAIGLGGFLTANWYSNEVKSHNIAIQEQAERQIESTIQQATFSVEDPLPSITFKVKAKRGSYHIVAGAFRSKENADTRLEELKESGYRPVYIGKNNYGLHQIIYDSFEDRKEAIQQLQKIRQQENPSAWLLVKELN